MESMLQQIHSPADLKGMSKEQLEQLCAEIRKKLVETVSHNGGHLSSNLGVVELTVALHRAFDAPKDKIVWDVGHQCYTHKMLTGRLHAMPSIRKEGGMSGFPRREESEYDPFSSGHASTSVSAALGLACSMQISGQEGKVVAVIGDGALSGGLAYEGLNNTCGKALKNFIVVLNDNKMSISHNVGSMAEYLNGIRAKRSYINTKKRVEKILLHTPLLGKPIHHVLEKIKTMLRSTFLKSTLFEDMGFSYYGPFDGHDLEKLNEIFTLAKGMEQPVFIHVRTTKGKGYVFAEKNPKLFHGISAFDMGTGEQLSSGAHFSGVAGEALCELARRDERICAITAAMKLGTGLSDFAKEFPNRFFDVGIAEEHAVTFSGGLANGGMLPVFAVYSTFLQRGYDQMIHDAALQGFKMVFLVDRAGFVGEDGETHQGLFDVAMFNSIPGCTVFSPSFFEEVGIFLHQACYECPGVAAVRYPRGGEEYRPKTGFQICAQPWQSYGCEEADTVLITYGRLFSEACLAQELLLEEGISVRVLKLNRIKPIPDGAIAAACQAKRIFFFEEGMENGGVGQHFATHLMQEGFRGQFALKAVDDQFVPQMSMQRALHTFSLDAEGMVDRIKEMLQKESTGEQV